MGGGVADQAVLWVEAVEAAGRGAGVVVVGVGQAESEDAGGD